MSVKKTSRIALILGALLLVVGVGPGLTGAATSPSTAQGIDRTGPTIPYAGRLTDESGQPVPDAAYDFTFALYSAETGGEAVWSEIQEEIPVRAGTFEATLGKIQSLSPDILARGAEWLKVSVRGPKDYEFAVLTPRQRLSAITPQSVTAPAAASDGGACPHSHLGETWTGTFLHIQSTAEGGNQVFLPGGLSGIQASSPLAGVYGIGEGSIGVGVLGSGGQCGVRGTSTDGYGGHFESNNDHHDLELGGPIGRLNSDHRNQESQLVLSSNADVVVRLDNDGGEEHAFRIKNSGGGDVFSCNEQGDCSCTGSKPATVKTSGFGWRQLYSVESTELWFEDLGTASLRGGEATVAFDPVFGQTVNLDEDYHVFVTPLCEEPALLFVTDKSSAGFVVKGVNLEGESSDCDFDYRVAAKRLGYEDVRLEETTWEEGK